MIIVITYLDKTKNRRYMSHGIDIETDKIIILPNEEPFPYCYYDTEIGEWILK